MPDATNALCQSCGAPIFYALTSTGKAMPIDVRPDDGGNLRVDYSVLFGGKPRVKVVKAGQGDHVSHFATCPNAAEHRR